MSSWLTRNFWRAGFMALLWMTLAATPAFAQHDGVISYPAPGATLSGTINVEGMASHPTFRKWQLDLLLRDLSCLGRKTCRQYGQSAHLGYDAVPQRRPRAAAARRAQQPQL